MNAAVFKTLIIDDEALARSRLRRLLRDQEVVFEIIGEASDGDEAASKINELKPDLVFLDIQMPGKDVFKMLNEIEHQPMIIFCTAYDHYALEAFKTNAIDYLVKPVEEERLQASVQKLKQGGELFSRVYQQLSRLHIPTPGITSIAHKCGNKIVPVKLENITYFMANEKYVNFYDSTGTEYITEHSLASLENKLGPEFLRISRSSIINRSFVKEIHRHFKGRYIFVLNDHSRTRIMSGATFKAEITSAFEL